MRGARVVVHAVQHAESGARAARTSGGEMTEGYDNANRVQLEGEQLESARQARQAIAENLMTLRGIVFNALGIEMATNQDLKITARVPINPDDCITVEDEHGCGMYCDPPGICAPCPPIVLDK
jgi:hypothetical protein